MAPKDGPRELVQRPDHCWVLYTSYSQQTCVVVMGISEWTLVWELLRITGQRNFPFSVQAVITITFPDVNAAAHESYHENRCDNPLNISTSQSGRETGLTGSGMITFARRCRTLKLVSSPFLMPLYYA